MESSPRGLLILHVRPQRMSRDGKRGAAEKSRALGSSLPHAAAISHLQPSLQRKQNKRVSSCETGSSQRNKTILRYGHLDRKQTASVSWGLMCSFISASLSHSNERRNPFTFMHTVRSCLQQMRTHSLVKESCERTSRQRDCNATGTIRAI